MVAAMVVVAVLAAMAQAAPPDRNVEWWIDESDSVDGAGVSLVKNSVGWVTYQRDLPGPKTVAVRSFHIARTYKAAAESLEVSYMSALADSARTAGRS